MSNNRLASPWKGQNGGELRKRERVALKKLKKSHFEILGGGPRLSVKALRLPLSEK